MRILVTAALLGALGFCAFGLVSTLEPLEGSAQTRWRIVYSALAAIFVAALVRLWRPGALDAMSRVERRVGEGYEDPRALRIAFKGAVFGLAMLILVLWPFAWVLRDGLGPDATETHGFEAAIRAFWTFYSGPITLASATTSLVLWWRLQGRGGVPKVIDRS